MIESELRDILQALLDDTGSLAAAIVADDDDRTGVPSKRRPLGGDRALVLELASRSAKAETVGAAREDDSRPAQANAARPEATAASNATDADAPTRDRRPHAIDAALEVAVRQLRAVARRWNVDTLPLVRVPPSSASADRVLARVEAFLRALAGSTSGHNAVLWHRNHVLASASPLDEVWRSRAHFLARRALAAPAPRSSHGEILDPDAYAMTFYYGAVLIVAVEAPYAVDFLRHRCRQVSRELAQLLPMMEPDPAAPAVAKPPP